MNKKILSSILVAAIFYFAAPLVLLPQIKAFPIDSWHSSITFSVKFGGLLDVRGNFRAFNGTIIYDKEDLAKLSATVVISTKSVDTGVGMRDDHLRSDDFFDVENYPRIVFSSKEVLRNDNNFTMTGDLTIRGVTRLVEIPFALIHGEEEDPWRNNRITFAGSLSLNRLGYGVNRRDKIDKAIGEKVRIELLISARTFNTETIALFKRPFGKTIWEKIEQEGIEAGIKQYHVLKNTDDKEVLKVASLDFIGTRLYQKKMYAEAAKIFALNAEIFPQKAETFSRLAEAYFMNGNNTEAVEAAKMALAMDAFNTMAQELLKLLDTR